MATVTKQPTLSSPKLSKYFTLSDMTITSIQKPNVPTPEALKNLKDLAVLADLLYEQVGPFKIISAYRSPEVQAALKSGAGGSSAASQAATHSFHSLGMALDLVPNNMSAQTFWAEIASRPDLKNRLGEIAIKQNALHISLATPNKQGVLMYVDKAGRYIRMAANEVSDFISKHKKVVVAVAGIGLPLALGFAIFMWMRSKEKK
jgi:hypothetical protein